jgi:WD40 repeat protein
MLTGSRDRTAILWDVATGKKRQIFKGHRHLVKSVALSRDGKQVWTSSADNTTRLWDTASGKELGALLRLEKDWLIVTPDGLFDGSKGAWNYVSYREAATRDRINDNATRKKFYRPGLLAQLVKGEKPDLAIELKSPKGPDLLVLRLKRDAHALQGGRPSVLANVAFTPDGKTLASIEDHTGPESPEGGEVDPDAFVGVLLRDVATRKISAKLRGPKYGVSCVAFSSDGKTLATNGHDHDQSEGGTMVRLWDVATAKEKASLKGHTFGVASVAFSSDGKTLVSGGGGPRSEGYVRGEVKLWDLSTGKEKASLKGHLDGVFAVAFSPDGKLIASGSGEFASNGQPGPGEVKIWDAATRRERASLKKGLAVIRSVAFSPDSMTLASADVFGNVVLWDSNSGKRTATLQKFNPLGKEENINPAYCVAFSTDGKTLAAGTVRGLKLWDVKTGKPLETSMWPTATVWSVAFSSDGKMIATAGTRQVLVHRAAGYETLRLWEWTPAKKADR